MGSFRVGSASLPYVVPASREKGWIVRCGGAPDCGFRALVLVGDRVRVHAAATLHEHICPDMHPTDIQPLQETVQPVLESK
jgi:hypothetical protein